MSYNRKAITDALSKMNKARKPKQVNDIIMDPEGQNKFPGLPTRIPSDSITMETTPYPVLGVDNFGNQQMMYPGANYIFPGADYVDEYPMMQIGGQRPIYVTPVQPNPTSEVPPLNVAPIDTPAPTITTNTYKPTPVGTGDFITYSELQQNYPNIHEKVKTNWQKDPNHIPFDEYVEIKSWNTPSLAENNRQLYTGDRTWEELNQYCPECLLSRGAHYERDENGNIYEVTSPVAFPLDFWEKLHDENYNINDFISIDTGSTPQIVSPQGSQQPSTTSQQTTSAPQQPSETPKSSEPKPKYHKEYNPYTGKNEPMSPKQKIELDRLYSRDLPMPENWQPELIETYRRQSGGATDWKSRIASAMNFQKGGQLSKEEFEKRKAAYKKMTGRDFEPPKSFKQSPQARKYYQNKYNQQPVIQSQPSETVQQSRGMSADEAEQLKIQNAPLDPRINQFSFEADNRSEEQRQRDQEAASQLTDPTGWNQVANYLQAPLFQAGNFWDYVSGGDDWEKAQQAYNLNQLNPYSQNKMFNFLNTGLSNTGNALMTGMEIADGYAIARALPGFGRQVGKTLSPQIKKQTPSLPDNVIPPQIHQAGLINMKGAFQKYPKGKLTKEELEAYMNSDFYKESLKRHREAKKAYGDKWDLDPLAKEYLRENFLTGNRTGINSVLYGGDNWSWPNYFMAGVIGGAMPSVAGLYGLALAPPAVRSKVMRSIGIQGVPGGLEAKDTTIDITNRNMDFARVNEIKDGTVIIGGEFIESSNNTVRKAKDWLRAEDTYSDKNYPSDKIESFYGVEDGKFKVGKAKDFKSETQLVPRRFGAKNINKAVLNGVEMRLLDNKGQPIYQNTPNTGKFILYSPSTKKAAFIYITNGKRGVEEVNKFLKENKDAQYIHLDNGRYEFYGVNEQGLTQQDFKNYYEQDLNRKGNPGYNLIIKKTGGTFFEQGGQLSPEEFAKRKAAYEKVTGRKFTSRDIDKIKQQQNLQKFIDDKKPLEKRLPTSEAEAMAMIESGELKVETIAQQQAREQREAELRKKEREAALEAYEKRVNTPGYNAWTGLPGESWRDMLAAEAAPLAATFRFSQGDNFIDDYINPAVWIGSMAQNLGESPQQAKETGSLLPYITSVGTPLLGGAMAGIGAKNTGQFVNNIVNPFAGMNPLKSKQLPGSPNNFNLEELRRVYHNSERFLQPAESRFLHKHGHGLRENYRTDMSNYGGWGTDQWDATVHNTFDLNKLRKPVNKSGLTKEDALSKASAKDKEIIAKMSNTEFENTVLKPNGEIAIYKPGTDVEQMTYDLGNRKLKLKDAKEMSEKEYVNVFNKNLDLLNNIIAKRNKSGIDYKVKELTPDGRLIFSTPEQKIPIKLSTKQKTDIEFFNKNPEEFLKNRTGLKKEGTKWKMSDEVGGYVFNSIEEAIDFVKKEMKAFTEPKIISGESVWGIKINPGQWKGAVEDITNTEYLRSIPGLEMSNTTSGVFADHVARRGTGAYESINEYLKKLDLGRVKPGFNSQTKFSKGAWENFIKSGKGVGFYNDPNTVYGTMKSLFPYIGAGALGAASQYQEGGTTEEELTPAQLAMMKARLAYAHMHGNPSAQRMVAPVDNPYIFTGNEPYASPDTAGYSGTHYMFSQGPFAVPTIQTGPDGQLYYNVNASPNDSEAMQFDSPEDAEVFARYYKTVAPAFQDMELTDEEIEEYKRGGCTIVKL
jgi:hypothetical protein